MRQKVRRLYAKISFALFLVLAITSTVSGYFLIYLNGEHVVNEGIVFPGDIFDIDVYAMNNQIADVNLLIRVTGWPAILLDTSGTTNHVNPGAIYEIDSGVIYADLRLPQPQVIDGLVVENIFLHADDIVTGDIIIFLQDMDTLDLYDELILHQGIFLGPDIVVNSLTVDTNPVVQPQSTTIRWTIKNQGNVEAIPVNYWFKVRLSADNVYDESDTYVAGRQILINLARDEEYSSTFNLNSGDYSTGNFYLVSKVDETNIVTESSENNNTRSLQFTIEPFNGHTVQGYVKYSTGVGFGGVTVRLTGNGENLTDYTQNDGYYDFYGLADGSYTVTAEKTGWEFTNNPQYPIVSGDHVWLLDMIASPSPDEVISKPDTPTGQTAPIKDLTYTYTTSGATSSLGHTVQYQFDWGDGTTSSWSTSKSASHTWSSAGTCIVTVTARCQIHTDKTNTSDPLEVGLPEPHKSLIALDDFFQTPKNLSMYLDVLLNDQDGNGGPLVDGAVAIYTDPANGGTLTLIYDTIDKIIGFEYAPPLDTVFVWDGIDDYAVFPDTFTYSAKDAEGNVSENSALVTIVVINQLPVAFSYSAVISKDSSAHIDLSGCAFDPDGDPIIIVLMSNITVQGGVVTLELGGSCIYTPPLGFVGNDSFIYYVTDGYNNSVPASVTITVTFDEPQQTVTIRGTVYDAASGEPIADANVTAGALSVKTDSSGHYELTGLSAGQITVTAEKAGYEPLTQTTPLLQLGQTYELNFNLKQKLELIRSLTVTPETVFQGESLTLTAKGVSSSVTKVSFWLDTNGNGVLDLGINQDTFLGVDTDGADGWSVQVPTETFDIGSNTYFARAQDNDGAWSSPVSKIGFVLQRPTTTQSITVTVLDQDGKNIRHYRYTLEPWNSQWWTPSSEYLYIRNNPEEPWEWEPPDHGKTYGGFDPHSYSTLQGKTELFVVRDGVVIAQGNVNPGETSFTFDVPPGVYEIISRATFQLESVEIEDTGVVYRSVGFAPPPTHEEGYDEYGRFEFQQIYPLRFGFWQPDNYGYLYHKLHTYTVYNTVQTQVMPGESDQAFVCIPDDKEFLRLSATRNLVDSHRVNIGGYDPLEPITNEVARLSATKATQLIYGQLLGSQLMGGLAGGQVTTYLYLGTTPNNDLDDYVLELGTSGAVATAGYLLGTTVVGGGVPGFVVGVGVSVVGSYIPAMIREENLRSQVAFSVQDDLVVALDPANRAVRVWNYGPDLTDVKLALGDLSSYSFSPVGETVIATLDSGESQVIGNVDEAFFQSLLPGLLFDCALIPGYKEVTNIGVLIANLQEVSPQPGTNLGDIQLSLASHADLHVYDPDGRHMGINYDKWILEQNIPGATFIFEDPNGIQQPLPGDKYIPTDWVQVVSLPAIEGVKYRTELVGTSEGPFELTITGFQNDELMAVQTYKGEIAPGEILATSTSAMAIEEQMTLLYTLLGDGSAMAVEPDVLTFMLHPGVQELTFTVIEDTGRQTLHDVTVHSSDIVGVNSLIDGSTVSFDVNNFDVAPGSQQIVHAFISVPVGFVGPASGTIVIESADGETKSIVLNAVPNQPPSFVAGPNVVAEEDAGPQTLEGWATVIAHETPTEGEVTLTFDVTNDNTALFSSQPAISSDGTLTFETAPNSYGLATVTVVLRDDEGTDCGGVDSSAPATFTILITSVNDAPIANVGPDQMVYAWIDGMAEVTLDGSGSSDPDGDDLTYTWLSDGQVIATGVSPTVELSLGQHTIVLVVNDGKEESEPDEVMITVQDIIPPEFVLSVTPNVLWPPNHKMVQITPTWTVNDNCDESPHVSLVKIIMNEGDIINTFDPIYDINVTDGRTAGDTQIGSDGSIYLRAERAGSGPGRLYTITYKAVDNSGNVTVRSAVVTVPHDQR